MTQSFLSTHTCLSSESNRFSLILHVFLLLWPGTTTLFIHGPSAVFSQASPSLWHCFVSFRRHLNTLNLIHLFIVMHESYKVLQKQYSLPTVPSWTLPFFYMLINILLFMNYKVSFSMNLLNAKILTQHSLQKGADSLDRDSLFRKGKKKI